MTRIALAIVPVLPRPAILVLARWLGLAGYLFARGLRRVGQQNLNLIYGESLSRGEKRLILKTSFQTLALVLADIIWFTRHPAERLRRHVHFDDQVLPVLEKTPLICVTGHLGNWETLGQAVGNSGHPLYSVAAPLKNPAVDRLFISSRELSGQIILSRAGALRKLLRILNGGGRFAILLDQNTKPSAGGAFVPFLGIPAPVSTGAAMLALRTHSHIAFGFAIPQPDGNYRVEMPRYISPEEVDEITAGRDDPVIALTEEIVRTIGEAIRRHPGCWLWMYRRWKYIAPNLDLSAYPAYAKPLPQDELNQLAASGR